MMSDELTAAACAFPLRLQPSSPDLGAVLDLNLGEWIAPKGKGCLPLIGFSKAMAISYIGCYLILAGCVFRGI